MMTLNINSILDIVYYIKKINKGEQASGYGWINIDKITTY